MNGTNQSPVIRLDVADNVVVARLELPPGSVIEAEGVTTLHDVPLGHKIATRAIAKGEPILKYNTIIGFAGEDTAPGSWMHSHNVLMDDFQKDYRFCQDYRPTELLAPEQRATFQGIRRPDGRVGTRNYIGVFITVNCSATVARRIATYFDEERLAGYPNVDGVVPFVHEQGCGMEMTGGAFRDGTEISQMPFPAYCRANTASTRPAYHRAVDMQLPIGCAEVAVYPGDIVAGDSDGVTVIPRHLAAVVAEASFEQELREKFLFTKIDAGEPLWGTYPANEATLAEFEAWKKTGGPL